VSGYFGRHIADLYFHYQPVGGHVPDCPAAADGVWEVAEYHRDNLAGRETVLRMVCRQCGGARFFTSHEMTYESTNVANIGFGAKPERVAGLWLHAGPPLWQGHKWGPTAFYVTTTKERPRAFADVAGIIGWRQGKRGGQRWDAGTGCSDYGSIQAGAGRDFNTKHAAAAWIKSELERPTAAAAAKTEGE
jgi:hypothetical protein